jgi:type VI secretion system secreted protein VgrG
MATINPNQKNRLLTLDTPLGADALIATSFKATERLSELFRVNVFAVSTQENIVASKILGKNVTLSVSTPKSAPRNFNGIVTSFSASYAVVRGTRAYQFEISPQIWLLTKTSDCRIFQNKTVIQITDAILSENGITNYKKQGITGSHPAREYCVQYMETDLDFLMRIWAEEGLYYYFTHSKNQHTLVLSDSCNGYFECQDKDVIHAPAVQNDVLSIVKWSSRQNFITGKVTLNDYNFQQPTANLCSTTTTTAPNPDFKSWEIYHYPGDFIEKSQGQHLSRDRMEQIESEFESSAGAGKYRSFCPGGKFTMKTHEVKAEQGKSYVLTSVDHEAKETTHIGALDQSERSEYENSFYVIPAKTVFRPPPHCRRPLIPGPQTAKVVGPSGEDIYCDKYGRIKVQFFWDRQGKNDENSSCWIRVSQMFAGSSWGAVFTPRVGMEVIVIFLEGDPDRPLVIGCVYNEDNMPPYTLPSDKTQSGIKTRSTTKGSSSTYSEMRIDDKKGSELFYLRAQKDFQREVINNDTTKINNDQSITVVNNRTEEVQKGNESITITKGNRKISVAQGNMSTTVSKGNVSMDIGSGNYALTLSGGNAALKCNGGSMTIQAATSITLKVGSNSIEINQSSITIKGTMVQVNATGTTKIAGQVTQISGSGMVKMSGGIININ